MPSKTCLIRQPAGLGDILFCHKLVDPFLRKGWRVIWPVDPQYLSAVRARLIAPGGQIEWVDPNSSFDHKDVYDQDGQPVAKEDFYYMPLQRADRWYHNSVGSVMFAKYAMMNQSFEDWRNFVKFRTLPSDFQIHQVLDFDPRHKCILVNEHYGTPPGNLKVNIDRRGFPQGVQVIEMNPGLVSDIFMWQSIINCAIEIHTVETSICYLAELSQLRLDVQLHMYMRGNQSSFDYVKGVYNKPWIYHRN